MNGEVSNGKQRLVCTKQKEFVQVAAVLLAPSCKLMRGASKQQNPFKICSADTGSNYC